MTHDIDALIAEAKRLANEGQRFWHLLRPIEAALRARYDTARFAHFIGAIEDGCASCRYLVEERGGTYCQLTYDEEDGAFASTLEARTFKHNDFCGPDLRFWSPKEFP